MMNPSLAVWEAARVAVEDGEEPVGAIVYAIVKANDELAVRPLMVGPPGTEEAMVATVRSAICPESEPAPPMLDSHENLPI
jgi:hypothetical protein